LQKKLWIFLHSGKKFRPPPVILMARAVGGFFVLVEGSAIAPFIYTSV
jgi:Family of unknown function (DUF5989)